MAAGRVVQLGFLQMELRLGETVEGADVVVMHMRQDHVGGGVAVDGPMPMDYFVWTAIGQDRSFVIVLASDVTHYYENMESGRPFTAAFNVGDMLEAYDQLRAHAPSPQHIIPGHDPLVMRRYPPPKPELEGLVVRLDVMPRD